MINKLINCYVNTHISELPSIINDNNQKVKNEFGIIYDSSLNMLKKSIYAPTGYVDSYFGDFAELQTEYLTVKNKESIKDSIYNETIKVLSTKLKPHNNLTGRWSNPQVRIQYEDTKYTHDASIIIYKNLKTVYDRISEIADGSVLFTGNNSSIMYSGKDILEIIEWKDSLETSEVYIDNSIGEKILYKMVCSSIHEFSYAETVNDILCTIISIPTDQIDDIPRPIVDAELLNPAIDLYEGVTDEVEQANQIVNVVLPDNTEIDPVKENTNDVYDIAKLIYGE